MAECGVLPFDDNAFNVEEVKKRMIAGIPPSSADEYLFRVRIESGEFPEIIVSNINPRDYDDKQTKYIPDFSPCFLPQCQEEKSSVDIEWENYVIAEFSELRQSLSRWDNVYENERKIEVPKLREEEKWKIFLYGDKQSKDKTHGHPPSTSLILQFDQIIVRKLLEYNVSWLQDQALSTARGCWIYALLARLDKPIQSDTAACLRRFLRIYCNLHNSESSNCIVKDKSVLKCYNILVSLTGRYFEQAECLENQRATC